MLGGALLLPKVEAAPPAMYKRKGYEQGEIDAAYARLMTGPKATPPRWKTIRRTILLMKNGIKFTGSGRNVAYRRAP